MAGIIAQDGAKAVLDYFTGQSALSISTLYVALLTADPSTSGPSSGPAVAMTDLVEDTTSGYARQSVSFTAPTSAVPSEVSNSSALTFGPYSANQATAVQWAALVTVSTGTSGHLLYTWVLDTSQQVLDTQSIVIPANDLTLLQD